MKSLVAKLAFRSGVGVFIDEHEVAISEVAVTPLGIVEVARRAVPTHGENAAAAIAEALAPVASSTRRRSTAVGLMASRVFLNTRPTSTGTTPEELLQKTLYSPNIRVDDYVIELLGSGPGRTSVTSVAACRKKYLANVMAALKKVNVRPVRVEPGPCALLRAAIRCHRTPGRVKTAIRVICKGSQGFAILTSSNVPRAWRYVELPPGCEVGAIVSTMRTLQGLSRHYGINTPLELLVIHGRPDLKTQLLDPKFAQAVGVRVECCDRPELDAGASAFGVALGALSQRASTFDFSSAVKPPASFWDLFPKCELVMEMALILFMGLWLWRHADGLDQAYQDVQTEGHRYSQFASMPLADLQREKAALQAKVDAVRDYLGTRLSWATYMHDFSTNLPRNVTLGAMTGNWDFDTRKYGRRAKPRKNLVLSASVPIPSSGEMPREIDALLKALRNDPLLKRNFPRIDLAGIQRSQSFSHIAPSTAELTVVCHP